MEHAAKKHITELCARQQHLLTNTAVNITHIKERDALMSELARCAADLKEMARMVKRRLHDIQIAQGKDIATVNTTLNNCCTLQSVNRADWSVVPVRKRAKPKVQANSKYTTVKITEALALHAIPVASFTHVRADGELYYVDSANHFAFRLAGHLFHGNIGTIYTDERNPDKIKNCKYVATCNKHNDCDYYHDPLIFPGSRDYRNFVALSWLYSASGSTERPKIGSRYVSRDRMRHFGSRANLDMDIADIQDDEVKRYHDQVAHDVLCSIVLAQYYRTHN